MSCSAPELEIGNQAPPKIDRSAVRPPITGPIESTVTRCPSRIPIAANGIRPTRISSGHLDPDVGRHRHAERRPGRVQEQEARERQSRSR